MMPKTVTADPSVSDGAFRVFGFLSLHNYQKGKKTNRVSISTRDLAEMYGKSHETVRKYLKLLENRGHIEILGKARGKATYRLTSQVFEYNVSVTTAPGSVTHVTSKELPQLRDKRRVCPHCHRQKQISSTSGVCGDCLAAWARKNSA